MYLDYKKIQFDKFGRPEVPNLLLQTKDRRTIGIIPNAINLTIDVKFSEPSEISFDLPSSSDVFRRHFTIRSSVTRLSVPRTMVFSSS